MNAILQSRSMGTTCLFFVIFLLANMQVTPALAGSVSSVQGNIVYANDANAVKQLTGEGKDTDPDVSPDGKQVVFIRDTPDRQADTPQGRVDVDEIWLIGVDGSDPHRILSGHAEDEPRRNLVGLGLPIFSPDGRIVFFMSAGWTTSSGIHAINIDGSSEHFVTDGNSLDILRSGRYKGYLIVNKHKYTDERAYDAFWLVSPSGHEIQNIGENDVDVWSFKKKNSQ